MMIDLRRAGPNEIDEIDALFDRLVNYSMAVDGLARRPHAAFSFINAVPPGLPPSRKHTFIIESEAEPVGLLDIIEDYPAAHTAFIGLLAIAEDRHGRGLGKAAYLKTERFARDVLNAHTLRLGVVTSNPVAGFWRKMGFAETGEVKPYEGESKTSTIVLMEKAIR